ncbi:MAG: family 78 glycoside hydrolase catalytic domain [Clostridia bacterium]|nr:family 78 glycoside hydrolase catalytic domain [Clostridia bacterium]
MFQPIKLSVNRKLLKGDARGRTVEKSEKMIFSWGAEGAEGAFQKAYRLKLSCNNKMLFDSGVVQAKTQACEVLSSDFPEGKRIAFSLSVFDDLGNESLEKTEHFYIGSTEWKAGWIALNGDPDGATVYFRREFAIDKPVKSVRMYAAGLGYHEITINGETIGNAYLDPAHTDYTKTVQYVFYPEMEKYFLPGENTIGVRVGGGWRDNNIGMIKDLNVPVRFFGKRQLSLALKIEYEDGEIQEIDTDETWQAGTGASVQSNLFDGEIFDANLTQVGWDKVGFDGFSPAMFTDAPGGEMRVMTLAPIREMGVYKPVSISHPKKGLSIIDFGQNLSGVVRMTLINLKKDQKIKVVHAEELDEDGTLYTLPLRKAKCEDVYIASGDDRDLSVWQPNFTYHGFRYASVEGYDVDYENIEAVLLHTDLESDSFFVSGSAQLNALQKQILMTERDNMHSILTDCPQRDERMGWMNDATVRFEETPYNFDCAGMFRKIVRDLMDVQSGDGAITCTAPFVFGARPADPVCSSFLVAGMQGYLHFNDLETIREAYQVYCAWENYLLSRSDNYIVDYSYYGDWAGPGYACEGGEDGAKSCVTPGQFMSTGYSYFNLKTLAQMARLLNREGEAQKHEETAEKVREAMLQKWYDAGNASIATGSMACQAFSLWLKIIPEKDAPRAAQKLRDDLVNANFAFTTGNLCSRYMLDELAEYGYIDEAYELLTREEYPSFGFMRQHEATTVWERFELKKNPGMNSHNHPMYGAAGSFLYKYIAGVYPEDAGYETFTVKPYMPEKLLSAQAGIDTRFGRINVRWTKRYLEAHLYVDVPFGTTCHAEFMGKKETWTHGTHMIHVPLER